MRDWPGQSPQLLSPWIIRVSKQLKVCNMWLYRWRSIILHLKVLAPTGVTTSVWNQVIQRAHPQQLQTFQLPLRQVHQVAQEMWTLLCRQAALPIPWSSWVPPHIQRSQQWISRQPDCVNASFVPVKDAGVKHGSSICLFLLAHFSIWPSFI